MRGRGRVRWGGERAPACGLGCGGDLGHISPHSCHGRRATFSACLPACLPAERGKRGPDPGWDGTFKSILTFSYGLYRGVWGPGNYPCGSGWGGKTPSIPEAQN